MDITYIQELGKGSFGSVWKVRDNNSGKELAIKKMKYSSDNLINPTDLKEIAYTKIFNHPNIISSSYIINNSGNHINAFIDTDNTVNTTIELMENSLDHFVKGVLEGKIDDELLTTDNLKSITYQATSGLYYMHSHGYTHNDIKPGNILYKILPDKKLLIKIADLGIAEYLGIPLPENAVGSGGTDLFKAPNSAEDLIYESGNRYNYKSDMFSVGATLLWIFSMLVQIPFTKFLKDGFGYVDINGAEYISAKETIVSVFTEDGYDFITKCLDPKSDTRLSSKKALKHPFLNSYHIGGSFFEFINSIVRKPTMDDYLNGNYELEYIDDMYNNYKDRRITSYIDLSSHTNVKYSHLELIDNWVLSITKKLEVDNMDAYFTYSQYYLQYLSKNIDTPVNKLQMFASSALTTSDNLWANVLSYITLDRIVDIAKGLFKPEQLTMAQLELLDTLDFNLSFTPVMFFLHYWYLKSIYGHPSRLPNTKVLTVSIALMTIVLSTHDNNRLVNLSVDDLAKYCVQKAIQIQNYSSNATMSILEVSKGYSDILDDVVKGFTEKDLSKRSSLDELKDIVTSLDN